MKLRNFKINILASVMVILALVAMALLSSCQVYSAKSGDTSFWSARTLMFDTKKGIQGQITDSNGHTIMLKLVEANQKPDSNSIKAITEGIVEGLKPLKVSR